MRDLLKRFVGAPPRRQRSWERPVDTMQARHQVVDMAILIDCDLYKSAVPVLAFLTPLVRPGTILVFDDWYCFKGQPDKGVQRATREWLADNPGMTLEKWHPMSHHGQSFIVQMER